MRGGRPPPPAALGVAGVIRRNKFLEALKGLPYLVRITPMHWLMKMVREAAGGDGGTQGCMRRAVSASVRIWNLSWRPQGMQEIPSKTGLISVS